MADKILMDKQDYRVAAARKYLGVIVILVLFYLIYDYVQYRQSNPWITFASNNICISKNTSFTVELGGGKQFIYDAKARIAYYNQSTKVSFNLPQNQTKLAFFCENITTFTTCSCQERAQEFCTLKINKETEGGFGIG